MGSKPSVAIVYGFAEGSLHGRKLRRSLRGAGYRITRSPKKADIIIGHSAGCYLIPHNNSAKLVLHIGYTYWPSRKLLNSLNENLRLERETHGTARWLVRCLVNDFYILNVIQTFRMLRGWHDPGLFLDKLSGQHLFIRNKYDSYCEPTQLMKRSKSLHTYISINSGNHNNIWDNPQAYVDLLQSVYDA